MIKQWIKSDDFTYSFSLEHQVIGEMKIVSNASEIGAVITLPNNHFKIKQAGNWNNKIEVSNKDGLVILTYQPEKWYASNFVIRYADKEYSLKVENNPLAQWSISLDNKEILSYGISVEDRHVIVGITTSQSHSNFLFDCLLWYLFIPVASENLCEKFLFLNKFS